MSKVEVNKDIALRTESLLPKVADMEKSEVAPGGAYLPFLELVYPIMLPGDNDIYTGHIWELGFKNGSEFQKLEKGTILTVLDIRKSIKREYLNEAGQNKNEYANEAISRGGETFNASDAKFQELLAEANNRDNRSVNLGNTVIIVAIFPDGKVAVVNFAGYKTIHGYLAPMLFPAKLQQGTGLRVDLDIHSGNLIKSAKGFSYPSAKKFSQWEHVTLTKEQLTKAVEAVKLVGDRYENWLKA